VIAVTAIAARAVARPRDSSNGAAPMSGISGVRKDGWITAIANANTDVGRERA
jgi:hypothetical protein